MSIESVLSNKSLIKGFLKPVFFSEYSMESALYPDDFGKVRDGYACARCLCEYTTYLVTCPACGHQRDVAQDLLPPDPIHDDHLWEREHGGNTPPPVADPMSAFMEKVKANRDIDHVNIKDLMPRRRK
jgi:hypothetical protein